MLADDHYHATTSLLDVAADDDGAGSAAATAQERDEPAPKGLPRDDDDDIPEAVKMQTKRPNRKDRSDRRLYMTLGCALLSLGGVAMLVIGCLFVVQADSLARHGWSASTCRPVLANETTQPDDETPCLYLAVRPYGAAASELPACAVLASVVRTTSVAEASACGDEVERERARWNALAGQTTATEPPTTTTTTTTTTTAETPVTVNTTPTTPTTTTTSTVARGAPLPSSSPPPSVSCLVPRNGGRPISIDRCHDAATSRSSYRRLLASIGDERLVYIVDSEAQGIAALQAETDPLRLPGALLIVLGIAVMLSSLVAICWARLYDYCVHRPYQLRVRQLRRHGQWKDAQD